MRAAASQPAFRSFPTLPCIIQLTNSPCELPIPNPHYSLGRLFRCAFLLFPARSYHRQISPPFALRTDLVGEKEFKSHHEILQAKPASPLSPLPSSFSLLSPHHSEIRSLLNQRACKRNIFRSSPITPHFPLCLPDTQTPSPPTLFSNITESASYGSSAIAIRDACQLPA